MARPLLPARVRENMAKPPNHPVSRTLAKNQCIWRFDESAEEVEAPSLKRFGFVQTLDTKSKRRLYEVLHAQNLQMNQDITFLSDGNDSLRQLQLEMSPKAIHILDWYHLSMKLTVLG